MGFLRPTPPFLIRLTLPFPPSSPAQAVLNFLGFGEASGNNAMWVSAVVLVAYTVFFRYSYRFKAYGCGDPRFFWGYLETDQFSHVLAACAVRLHQVWAYGHYPRGLWTFASVKCYIG